jgi:DivIVA domain-containing protein
MAEKDRNRTEAVGRERPEPASSPASLEPAAGRVPADIRDVSFHPAVRGYARREVDRYVERVNGVIAELEISRSPESAVRHALDRVGEQTSGILQQAGETADEITQTARADAEATVAGARSETSEIVTKAKAEAERIVEDAAAQAKERRAREEKRLEELRRRAEEELRALRSDTDAIRAERRRLLEGIEELTASLQGLVDARAEDVESGPAPGDGQQPADARDHDPANAGKPGLSREDDPSEAP